MIAEASGTGTIAEFLQPLERFGCRRLDSRSIPSSDEEVDHVLIAPPGVFVISAKGWDSRLEVADGVLRRDGFAQVDEVQSLVSQAAAISSLLDSWTGESVSIPVHAVMAFVGSGQIGGWAALTGAHAVDGRSLAEFITKFPAVVGIEHVNWAYQALDDHLPVRLPPSPPVAEPAVPSPSLKLVPPVVVPSAPEPRVVEPPSPPAFESPAAFEPPTPAYAPPAAFEPPPPAYAAPPVVEPPAPPAPVAVAPPMADASRQVPNEPIVFLARAAANGEDRFYVRDEEGYPGGYVDMHTGQGVGLTPVADTVFQVMLSAYLPDTGHAIDDLPFEVQSAIRYFLGSGLAPPSPDVPAVVACLEGHIDGRPRLYASLLQPGGRRTDLGWIDLVDRHTSPDVPGVDPILRYCGDAFVAVTPH